MSVSLLAADQLHISCQRVATECALIRSSCRLLWHLQKPAACRPRQVKWREIPLLLCFLSSLQMWLPATLFTVSKLIKPTSWKAASCCLGRDCCTRSCSVCGLSIFILWRHPVRQDGWMQHVAESTQKSMPGIYWLSPPGFMPSKKNFLGPSKLAGQHAGGAKSCCLLYQKFCSKDWI